MPSTEPYDVHPGGAAEVAAEITSELEEIQEEYRLRKAQAHERAQQTNRRLDAAIKQGNAILTGVRDEPAIDS